MEAMLFVVVLILGAFCGCIGGTTNKAPSVTISATPKNGYQPLEVNFTVNATDPDGTIDSCKWTFGDGSSSLEMNTTHTFDYGTYNVTLNVTDNNGKTTTKQVTITVNNHPPSVTASANPTSGKAPLEVSFTCSGTDQDGNITSYEWDFGDGSTSNSQNTTHTFQQESTTYIVTLTATDNDGATTEETISVTTAANELPSATATANPTSGTVPLSVDFTGSGNDPDGSIQSYHWEFGDGSTSNNQNPTHTYDSIGEYTATLTVTDNTGGTNTDSVTINVEEVPPFQLNSWEIIDNVGTPAIRLTFTIDQYDEVDIEILDSVGRTVGYAYNVDSSESMQIVDIGSFWEVISGDTYEIVVESSDYYGEELFSKKINIQGPSLTVTNIETVWSYDEYDYEDWLEELSVTMRNDGDVPIYVDTTDIAVDNAHRENLNFYGTPSDDVVLPGETRTFDAIVFISDIPHSSSHLISLEIKDDNRNVLDTYSETEYT